MNVRKSVLGILKAANRNDQIYFFPFFGYPNPIISQPHIIQCFKKYACQKIEKVDNYVRNPCKTESIKIWKRLLANRILEL